MLRSRTGNIWKSSGPLLTPNAPTVFSKVPRRSISYCKPLSLPTKSRKYLDYLTWHITRTLPRYYRFVLGLVRVIAVADVGQSPLETWQSKVWDPEVGTKTFDEFCALLNSAWGFPVSVAAQDLEYEHPDRMVSLSSGLTLDLSILQYASWIKDVGGSLLLRSCDYL